MNTFSKFKRIFLIVFLLLIYSIFSAFSYTNAVFKNISSNIFRLHVIANSDSKEDQSLKYIVRDNVLEYVKKITYNCTSKQDAIKIISENLQEIQSVAQNTVYNNGYHYDVKTEIGNFEFPLKTYGNVSFPAGYYDAIRITIGNGNGQNWWCVMFPPLCFVDVSSGVLPDTSKQTLKENLSEEEYQLLTSDNFSIKFKLLELFQNINTKIANK